MSKEYEFSLKQVHFRSSLLTYKDNEETVEVYLEESAVPEYNWIGAEPDFKVEKEKLEIILKRLKTWSETKNLNIKIWAENELGI